MSKLYAIGTVVYATAECEEVMYAYDDLAVGTRGVVMAAGLDPYLPYLVKFDGAAAPLWEGTHEVTDVPPSSVTPTHYQPVSAPSHDVADSYGIGTPHTEPSAEWEPDTINPNIDTSKRIKDWF